MEIKRDGYLKKIISCMGDGQVEIIAGIRRCGKTYPLRNLFHDHLLQEGATEGHILSFELDPTRDIRYRNPPEPAAHVRHIADGSTEQYYLFVDEIQMSDEVPNPYNPDGKKITFYDALNDLKSLSNLDICVTGGNSKMLSDHILTEFRGRSDEIRVHPLSFAEYYAAVGGDKQDAFDPVPAYRRCHFLSPGIPSPRSLCGTTSASVGMMTMAFSISVSSTFCRTTLSYKRSASMAVFLCLSLFFILP